MKSSSRPAFSRRLNQLMEERRMTVRTAAKYAQVATSTVQNWRSGHTPTDFTAVKRLAEALDVSFCFLLTGEEDPTREDRLPSIAEYFEFRDVVFDGFAKITIQPLAPKKRELLT